MQDSLPAVPRGLHFPAGGVTLSGPAWKLHRPELHRNAAVQQPTAAQRPAAAAAAAPGSFYRPRWTQQLQPCRCPTRRSAAAAAHAASEGRQQRPCTGATASSPSCSRAFCTCEQCWGHAVFPPHAGPGLHGTVSKLVQLSCRSTSCRVYSTQQPCETPGAPRDAGHASSGVEQHVP